MKQDFNIQPVQQTRWHRKSEIEKKGVGENGERKSRKKMTVNCLQDKKRRKKTNRRTTIRGTPGGRPERVQPQKNAPGSPMRKGKWKVGLKNSKRAGRPH